jgi:intergrase/recombinase
MNPFYLKHYFNLTNIKKMHYQTHKKQLKAI